MQKLRENGAPTPVAKLFSKHMKISDQKKLLATTAFDIVIGTPNRLAKLLSGNDTDASKKEDVLENGSALSLSNCELLVIDATYKDAKKFSGGGIMPPPDRPSVRFFGGFANYGVHLSIFTTTAN